MAADSSDRGQLLDETRVGHGELTPSREKDVESLIAEHEIDGVVSITVTLLSREAFTPGRHQASYP